MKTFRKISILLLVATAAAAYVWLRFDPEIPSVEKPVTVPCTQQAVSLTNETPTETPVPVQPLEERGDAMLFEIDALQNTPFDEAVVQPFD